MMEKQKRLVQALYKKTMAGQLDWAESIQKGSFQVSLRGNSVRIREFPSRTGEGDVNDYEISLVDEEGRVVDAFQDVEVGDTIEQNSEKQTFYRQFRDLYDMARRTALGSEKILNEILNELDD